MTDGRNNDDKNRITGETIKASNLKLGERSAEDWVSLGKITAGEVSGDPHSSTVGQISASKVIPNLGDVLAGNISVNDLIGPDARAREMKQTLDTLESRTNTIKADLQNIFESARQATARLAEVDIKAEASEGNLAAFMEAARARGNFESIMIHWADRGRQSAWAFWGSAVVLGICLVALPVIALYNADPVIAFLHKLADVAAADLPAEPHAGQIALSTIGRLVVVTLPIALYFWMIRLIVRFNTRSLLLMDDARQRSTMLETYYRMIEKQAATEQERALVLQALFRPAPGHGADTVEPPNFTEVLGTIGRKGG